LHTLGCIFAPDKENEGPESIPGAASTIPLNKLYKYKLCNMEKLKFRPDKPEKHEQYVWDDYCNGVVYESPMQSTLVRTDSEMVFTIRASKHTNWKRLADLISNECTNLHLWAFEQHKHYTQFEQLPTIEVDIFEVPAIMNRLALELDAQGEDYEYDGEEELFMLIRADQWWEMYESDENYLIRYRMPKCEKYPLCCSDDIDALQFLVSDESYIMTYFLRFMYERVNGYNDTSIVTNEYDEEDE